MCIPCCPCCPCCVPCCRYGILCLGCWAVICFILGLTLLIVWPVILKNLMQTDFTLSKGSLSYKIWTLNPQLNQHRFFVFNWTNPEEFQKKLAKPHFQEIGPYVFYERTYRTNIAWLNATVKYDLISEWKFSRADSKGTLEDLVVTINPEVVRAYHRVQDDPDGKREESRRLEEKGMKLATKMRVRDLFKHYSLRSINQTADSRLQQSSRNSKDEVFKRFGGRYTISRGSTSISTLGNVVRVNGAGKTDAYGDGCNEIAGSLGDLWAPLQQSIPSRLLFVPKLCRFIKLVHMDHAGGSKNDYTYWGFDESLFESGKIFNQSRCFCPDSDYKKCPPAGLLDLSKCWKGMPVFASFPHFYKADSLMIELVTGLIPSGSQHSSFLEIEARTGVPQHTHLRFQYNVQLKHDPAFEMFKNIPKDIYMPVLWCDQKSDFQDRASDLIREVAIKQKMGLFIVISLFVLTGVMLICILTIFFRCFR